MGELSPRALQCREVGETRRIQKGDQEGVAREADKESSTWCRGSKMTNAPRRKISSSALKTASESVKMRAKQYCWIQQPAAQ